MNHHSNSEVLGKLMLEVNFNQFTLDRVKFWPVPSFSRYKNMSYINYQ